MKSAKTTNIAGTQLLPCPFCGSPAHMWRYNCGTVIECSNYNPLLHRISVEARNTETAIKLWNRRMSFGEANNS